MNVIDLATKTLQTTTKTVVDAIKTVVDGTKTKVDTIDTRTTTMNTNLNTVNANLGAPSTAASSSTGENVHAKLNYLLQNASSSGSKQVTYYTFGSQASSSGTPSKLVTSTTGSQGFGVYSPRLLSTVNGSGTVHLLAGGNISENLPCAMVRLDENIWFGVHGGGAMLNVDFNSKLEIYCHSTYDSNVVKIAYSLKN